jgi:hypothetical protein
MTTDTTAPATAAFHLRGVTRKFGRARALDDTTCDIPLGRTAVAEGGGFREWFGLVPGDDQK